MQLDIVALDRRALVFVEVKAVRAGGRVGPERPVLWVTPRKQSRVRRLAAAWMAERRADGSVPRYAEIRFDAVGILVGPDDEVLDLEHLVGAFERLQLTLDQNVIGELAVEPTFQAELGVGDALEGAPVERRDADLVDRRAVLGLE